MLESILKRIDAWKRLGFKESPEGSRIIGHTPRDFPEAYLHSIFAARTQQDWQAYGIKLPTSLKELYSECNGLSLFGGAIAIYGIRTSYRRDDSAQYQPFDLITHDQEHRLSWHALPGQAADERVYFGSYDDGSGIYVEAESPKVLRVICGALTPVNEWKSIKNFLEFEYDRISTLFTSDGYLLRDGLNTSPPANRPK